jgi:hypothetical protein
MANDTSHTGAWILGLAGATGVGIMLGLYLGGKAVVYGVEQGYLAPTQKAFAEGGVPNDVADAAARYAASRPGVQGWISANGRGQYGRR